MDYFHSIVIIGGGMHQITSFLTKQEHFGLLDN